MCCRSPVLSRQQPPPLLPTLFGQRPEPRHLHLHRSHRQWNRGVRVLLAGNVQYRKLVWNLSDAPVQNAEARVPVVLLLAPLLLLLLSLMLLLLLCLIILCSFNHSHSSSSSSMGTAGDRSTAPSGTRTTKRGNHMTPPGTTDAQWTVR